ncbi:pentatricopeptide repeat-containing protein At3g26630, chloroplastic-like [Selaginella moellendorffii]|uniref:pentatricopeptide repeat-containing protein At3g26630, chloroplastic-like n=1 Tax=Selaginella moellendorffii TaxID=88036 RepID=UPI000D1C5688|nr:pentatricopeptide repeat-containing protein At3g26630, chloroplastic-like [Selaginella moellendorffii]|eukprot:XP_024528167.1 pentatricopeptide repeat-containing protein At3g26630, chloroplastic-like [Selaginella moellendorffii]
MGDPASLEARFASHRNIKPRSGRWKEAIFNKSVKDAVEEEQQEKSPANVGKYASLIRSCTATQNLSDGRRLHHHIASHPNSKYRKDRFLGNLLVNMYGKCGCVDEARAVFDAIAHPNVFSWNMILAAYALNGQLDKAKSTFEEMPEKDAASWTCMIAAYGQVRQLFEARELFDSMQNPSVVPWNAIISAYAHAGHQHEAVALFRKMDLAGTAPNEITFVTVLDACAGCNALSAGKTIHTHIESTLGSGQVMDVVLATALVSMYGKCGGLAEARKVFDRMEPSRRNVVCWTSMLAAHAASGDLDEATRLFEAMPVRNTVSWNAMISACVQNKELACGLIVFNRMDMEGIQADEISFLSALDACAGLPAVSQGQMLHAELLGMAIDGRTMLDDVRISTALVHFYAKIGLLGEARRVFDKGPRNAVSWNAMVSAYAGGGHGARAVETLRGMELEGFSPDQATFVALLSACSHAGLLGDGLSYFARARHDFGLVANRDHYVCLVDLLGRASWVEEAEELLGSMPFEAHSVAWMTLLGCSKLQRDFGRASRAAANAWNMEPGNAASYVLLNTT